MRGYHLASNGVAVMNIYALVQGRLCCSMLYIFMIVSSNSHAIVKMLSWGKTC